MEILKELGLVARRWANSGSDGIGLFGSAGRKEDAPKAIVSADAGEKRVVV